MDHYFPACTNRAYFYATLYPLPVSRFSFFNHSQDSDGNNIYPCLLSPFYHLLFKSLCSDLCPCHSVQTTPANVTNDLQDIVNVNRWFSCPGKPLSLDTIGHSSLKSASLGFCYFLVFLFFSCSFSNSFRGFSIVAYLWMELTGKSASIQTSMWTLHLNFHLPSAHFHWLS